MCDVCGFEIENPLSATYIWEYTIHGRCYNQMYEVGFQMAMFKVQDETK